MIMDAIRRQAKDTSAQLLIWMASRSSRNQSRIDKLCRMAVNKVSTQPPEHDFMRDEMIDNDQGFDPDELERYERGETR
ncbi:MAG: hypothetical protein AAGF19_01675 [Pseudomonadota bacterium]